MLTHRECYHFTCFLILTKSKMRSVCKVQTWATFNLVYSLVKLLDALKGLLCESWGNRALNEQQYSPLSWWAVCCYRWHHPSWEEHLQTVSSPESLELCFSSVAQRLWSFSQVCLRLFVLPVTVLAVITGSSNVAFSTEEQFPVITLLISYEFSHCPLPVSLADRWAVFLVVITSQQF